VQNTFIFMLPLAAPAVTANEARAYLVSPPFEIALRA
jgi:hypothetical protein